MYTGIYSQLALCLQRYFQRERSNADIVTRIKLEQQKTILLFAPPPPNKREKILGSARKNMIGRSPETQVFLFGLSNVLHYMFRPKLRLK